MLTTSDLQFFAAVAHAPSLAAASRMLDVTPSAVTQRLADLERRLGVRLLNRTGRRLTLTDEGELLANAGREIIDDVSRLSESLASRRGVITGHLRVLAPFGFGRRYVAPLAGAFATAHPGVSLELLLSDRLGRIPETSWDVAIHIGELRDSSLVAQRLAPNARVLCAAPALLAQHAAPTSPADLRRLPLIALRENDEDVTMWRFMRDDGTAEHLRIEPLLASNDGDVVRDWALAGLGVILRSEWSVAEDIREGRLLPMLPAFATAAADIVALVGPRSGRSARVTHFVDYLKRALSPAPWRTA